MDTRLILATDQGVVVSEREGERWKEVRRGLEEQQATSIIAREGVILAGTRDGVYRSSDLGATWDQVSDGLTARHIRWLAFHPEISDFELAGTEPAEIFISRNSGETWEARPEVARMRQQHGWRLPYSPEAGCVRGFAIHGLRAYAAVEDGCVLVSKDGGMNWELAEGSSGHPDHRPAKANVHSDVHSIHVHPFSPDWVWAPTGGGLYTSRDGGKTWRELYSCYCRAAWIDPVNPDHFIFGPADGVDYNGRIEETQDGGATWKLASQGLNVPWRNHMVERFRQIEDELFAVLSNGELLHTPLDSLEWQRVLPHIQGVNAVTGMAS